ncbi:hypothetical protein CALCODRAFT_483182 [Calocera cornea HHB12733]|uniref:Uncharacterized protein n=1 Tax=Calocera cornea HHB12733 TaxID=1353952 RepID=A0A165FY96_9BASI|nr:hypothetical protein CALCODRAFT_483182 [Calocera cornea HHB12733]
MFSQSFSPASDFLQALEATPEPQRSIEKARLLRWMADPRGGNELAVLPESATVTPQPASTQSSGFLSTPPSSASVASPLSSQDTPLLLNNEVPLSQTDMGDLHRRLIAVEAAVVHPPAKRRKKRSKVDGGAESLPAFPSTNGVNPAKLHRGGLDENELDIKRYLQAQVRNQMYAAMQYKVGDKMPCHGDGRKPDDPNLLWPDFRQDINGETNRLLQMRAAIMVLEDSRNHPENVHEAYRDKWLTSAVLVQLARISWPHLKQVWNKQRLEVKDGGAAKRKNASASRRAEKRRTRTGQMRNAIKDFCIEHDLDADHIPLQLVDDQWVGEEWSGDEEEDGNKTSRWRQNLYATGKLTVDERDEEDALFSVLEIKRPEWMHMEVWTWYQSIHAKYMKKVACNGKPGSKPGKRIDLGRTSSIVPSNEPFDFMLDDQWVREELPKVPDWEHKPGLPEGVPETIVRIIRPSL